MYLNSRSILKVLFSTRLTEIYFVHYQIVNDKSKNRYNCMHPRIHNNNYYYHHY